MPDIEPNDIFSRAENWGSQGPQTKLDDYLQNPTITSVDDPIAWWCSQLKTGDSFARMVLDFLSAPG